MKYYKVSCPRGHFGVGRSGDITFAFKADNALTAMDMARKMPGVKHTSMIYKTTEITAEEYFEFRKTSAYNKDNQSKWKK